MAQSSSRTTVQKSPSGPEDIPGGEKLKREAAFPWLKTIIFSLLMVVYTGSPIDLIPDLIPGLGLLDDLLVDLGLLGLLARALIRWLWLRNAVARGDTPRSLSEKAAA